MKSSATKSSTTGDGDVEVRMPGGSRMMCFGMVAGIILLTANLAISSIGMVVGLNDDDHDHAPTRDTITPLDSRFGDIIWDEIEDITLQVGHVTMRVAVEGVVRIVSNLALFGSFVHLTTHYGTFTLDGQIIEFDDAARAALTTWDIPLVRTHNRINGTHSLLGHFRTVPEILDTTLPADEFPSFTLTYTAQMRTLYACIVDGDDQCAHSELRQEHLVVHDNRTYAVGHYSVWSDFGKGKIKERFHTMPYLTGWYLDREYDLASMLIHSAQVWETTSEHYYCTQQVAQDRSAFGLHGLSHMNHTMYSARVGVVEVEGFRLVEYRLKHKEATGHLTQILVHENTGYPYRLTMVIFDPRNFTAPVQRTSHLFDSFTPVTEVSDSIFQWPGYIGSAGYTAPALFNETVCAATLPYTVRNTETAQRSQQK